MTVFASTVVYPARLRDTVGGRTGGGTTGFEGREVLGLLHGAGVVTVERRYAPGEILFAEGDPGDGLYVLAEGAVKLSRGYPGGNEITLMLLGPWEVFGDLAFGRGAYQHARAEAMTDCRVSKVPKVFVERSLKARPEMALKVVDLLRLELVRQREMNSCLLPRKVETKLARLLPLLARRFGEEDEVGLVIRLRLTQEELAKMVSTTRESVCQALASLRRQGMLALVAGRMVILDPAGLERLAHGPARKSGKGPNIVRWPASPDDHARPSEVDEHTPPSRGRPSSVIE